MWPSILKTSGFLRILKSCFLKLLKYKRTFPAINKSLAHNKKSKKSLLWLDDRLNPRDPRMDWIAYSPIGRDVEVIWVKNFLEFKTWIIQNGLPDGICFDHDLGIRDYNGYDCAEWLVEYCQKKEQKIPAWASQSPNPEEKVRINRFLKKFNSTTKMG